jgi:hypothetical protein
MTMAKNKSKTSLFIFKDFDRQDGTAEQVEQMISDRKAKGKLSDEDAVELKQRLTSYYVKTPDPIVEEYDVYVTEESGYDLYDACPIKKLLVDCPNLTGKSTVWVLSRQIKERYFGCPYEIEAVVDDQEGAFNVCRGSIPEYIDNHVLFRTCKKIKIHVRKIYTPISSKVKLNIRTELYIRRCGVVYRVGSHLYLYK